MQIKILMLIAKVLLIISRGQKANEAVFQVAKESGISFGKLWDNLPDEYK